MARKIKGCFTLKSSCCGLFSTSLLCILFFHSYSHSDLGNVTFKNLTIYNLIHWFAWTNDSSTNRLTFQLLFFFLNNLQNSLQKSLQFIFLIKTWCVRKRKILDKSWTKIRCLSNNWEIIQSTMWTLIIEWVVLNAKCLYDVMSYSCAQGTSNVG